MPKKKRLSINFPIERAILSDFLPFEVPITFSNRHLYNFLIKQNIKYNGQVFTWNHVNESVDSLILLLLGLRWDTNIEIVSDDGVDESCVKPENKDIPTISFQFPISHKIDESRYLSLIHPKAQVIAVNFYDEYKDIITYYCSGSEYSLRAPSKIAACTYIDNRAIIEDFEEQNRGIEVVGQNYDNLRSFFVYKKYSNIYKFYESEEHHSCERNFNFLSKLDVSKCFDSIYTHSISWAVLGKKYAKENLTTTQKTFSYKFDRLMQRLNYNETAGIVIGPEISRIFAEIILQAVDGDIFDELNLYQYRKGIDYQVYRYVDDYFVFYNDKSVFKRVRSTVQIQLKEYKLSLNKGKEETYERPIITPITIAKKRIGKLLEERLSYKEEQSNEDENIIKKKIYIHESSITTDFKSILATSGVTYSDILNYTLSIIERKIKSILSSYTSDDDEKTKIPEKQLVNAIMVIINFTYFIYAVAPKVNSTIRLCRIIQQILIFVKNDPLGKEYQHIIFREIFDCSRKVIETEKVRKDNQIESLYLLVLLKELGRSYWLDTKTLSMYFNFECSDDNVVKIKDDLHYFSISVLLYYISKKIKYKTVREEVIKHILEKYRIKRATLLSESEMTHMSLDLISCPYIGTDVKRKILDFYNIPKSHHKRMISFNKYWFTKWDDFDFAKELDAKRSLEVY